MDYRSCEKHIEVRAPGLCPICLIEERDRLRRLIKAISTLGRFYILYPIDNIVECEFCEQRKPLDGRPFVHEDDCPIGAAEEVVVEWKG